MDKHVKRLSNAELQRDWVLEQQPTHLHIVPDSPESLHYIAPNCDADDECEVAQ